MKKSILLFTFLLTGCFGYSLRNIDNQPTGGNIFYEHKPPHNTLDDRKKDFSSCGFQDWFAPQEDGVNRYLCVEKKGWYLEGGPICESDYFWKNPICIAWRKKYSKPDAKPWISGNCPETGCTGEGWDPIPPSVIKKII